MDRGMSAGVGRAWRAVAVIAVLAAAVASATAAEIPASGDFNREGGFLGANATAFVPAFQDAAGEADFGASAGFGLRGGYRYDEIFATEALYEFAADFGADKAGASARYRSQSFTVSGRLIVPWSTCQPWLSGGIGFAHGNLRVHGVPGLGEAAATSFAGRVATGIDVPLTDDLGLFVEAAYLMPTRDLGDFQTFAAGAGLKVVF